MPFQSVLRSGPIAEFDRAPLIKADHATSLILANTWVVAPRSACVASVRSHAREPQEVSIVNTIFFGRVGIGFSHPTVNMLQLRISQILFRNQVALYGGPNHRRPPLLVDATDFVFHFEDGLFRLPMFVRGSSQSKRMVTWHGERNAFSESSNHVSTYRGGGLRILQRTSADWCGFAESEHGSVSANGPSTVPDGKIGPPEALMLEIVMLSEACRTELQGVGPNMAFVGPGQGWERWKATPEGTEWREKVRALMKREDLDQVGQRGNLSTPTAR